MSTPRTTAHQQSVVAFLLGTFALLRGEEVVRLRRCDIVFYSTYITITIVKSKTDQFRRGAKISVGQDCSAKACPVHRLREYQREPRGDKVAISDSAFPFDKTYFSKKIHELLLLVYPEGRLSSHAMRRTGANLLLEAGEPMFRVVQFGRWANDSCLKQAYTQGDSAAAERQATYSSLIFSTAL